MGTRSICTSHIVEKEEGPRVGQTLKHLRALISICKMLVQHPRTLPPSDTFLMNFPPPYFLLAVIKSCCEDYKDPYTGESRDSTDVLAVNKLMNEILAQPNARHYKHVSFLDSFRSAFAPRSSLLAASDSLLTRWLRSVSCTWHLSSRMLSFSNAPR